MLTAEQDVAQVRGGLEFFRLDEDVEGTAAYGPGLGAAFQLHQGARDLQLHLRLLLHVSGGLHLGKAFLQPV